MNTEKSLVLEGWQYIGLHATLSGVELIAFERARQIEKEKWSACHDDSHNKFELTLAAIFYAAFVASPGENLEVLKQRLGYDLPWSLKWWKPSADPIRNLIKSGALIAAEIDRLIRLQKRSKSMRRES